MAKKLGMSVDAFYETIEGNLDTAKNRVKKQREKVVKSLAERGTSI